MEKDKTPKTNEKKMDGFITIGTKDDEELSYQEAIEKMISESTKIQKIAQSVAEKQKERLDVLGKFATNYAENFVTPVIDNLLKSIGGGITEKLGFLSKNMIEAFTKPLIEQANLFHKKWIEELAKIKSNDEIKEQIKEAIYKIGDPIKELEEELKQKDLPEDEKQRRRDLLIKELQQMEDEYFEEVMFEKAKIQGFSTEEELELTQNLNEIIKPTNTAFLTGKNITKIFSQKENLKPKEPVLLANDKIKIVREVDEEGNVSTQKKADFFIQYVFENGLEKGEWTLKERLVFQNIVYYAFVFDKINEINRTKLSLYPSTENIQKKRIPTIVPKEQIARMTRGQDDLKKRVQTSDYEIVDEVMDKFKKKKTYINYEDLKEKYKEQFGEDIDLDEFQTIGEAEFSSFIDSELHEGIDLKKEFEKFGMKFLDEDVKIEKFDGYVVNKIPIFQAINMQKQVQFLPYKMNNYLQQSEVGIAINLEMQSLISGLEYFIEKTNKGPLKYVEYVSGAFVKYAIDDKGKPIKNYDEKKKDKEWKRKHFNGFRYKVEENIDTFFQHCYDSISIEEEALQFGHYEGKTFIASGKEKHSTATQRQRRTKHLNKMETYLTKAKDDTIILDYYFSGKTFENKEVKVNRKDKRNKVPIEKIVIVTAEKKDLKKIKAIERIPEDTQ